MKRILKNFILQALFWMLYFAFARAAYILYLFRDVFSPDVSLSHVLSSFVHALKLDLATMCYFMIIPFLLLLIQSVYSPRWINYVNKVYTGILIVLYSLLTAGELGVYREWGTKLHFKGLLYLTNPSEVYNSSDTSTFFLLVLFTVALFGISFFMYNRFFYKNLVNIKRNLIFSFLFLIFTPGLLFLGLRGGIREIPINLSDAYYSKHNILNLAATNSGYNISISIIENWRYMGVNPFDFYDMEEAERVIEELYFTPFDSTNIVLTTKRPNIVIILLESWAGDLIESLGGDPGITPEFAKLEKGGILFTNVYSSGTRSEQGMGCVFGGFPAHPISSISVQPNKYGKLPSLTRLLNESGYYSSFYFGGQLVYGNMKSYIMYNGFDLIMEGADFDNSIPRGKLGIHDGYMMDIHIEELNKVKEPFFSVLYTVSTHSPFDMPLENPVDWGYNDSWGYNNKINEYLNSAYYTDQCLGDYIRKASEQSWFDNTLFVILADHSHYTYRKVSYHSPRYHKIPLLLYGAPIKEEYRGTKVEKIGSQVDLAATILPQLDIDASEFVWGKNLLNPYTPEFAYVAFEEGIGWIKPQGGFFYDNRFDDFYYKELDPKDEEKLVKEGKSLLQVFYQRYLDY